MNEMLNFQILEDGQPNRLDPPVKHESVSRPSLCTFGIFNESKLFSSQNCY